MFSAVRSPISRLYLRLLYATIALSILSPAVRIERQATTTACVLHGPHGGDVPGRAAEHLLGGLADGEHLLGAVAGALDRDHRGLVGHDPLATHERQRVRRPEVDGEVVREESVDPVEEHGIV